jgi:4-amino-4-deoxychorismate lyase
VVLINGQPDNRIAVSDRGLQYGDGLFETVAYRNGQLEFLQAHLTRLLEGCKRLKLKFTELEKLNLELTSLCTQTANDSVIKVMLTRGSGGRGYKAPVENEALRILSSHPMPEYPISNQTGITIRICEQRLGINPQLAGIKHLNRLEQVLARSEWDDSSVSEGLMLDINDNVVEGTMTNVFIIKHGELYTPSIHQNGIAGIMRAEIIELAGMLGLHCHQQALNLDDFFDADEVFVSNSIINIWPVTALTEPDKHWDYGPVTQQLQSALQQLRR